MTARRRQGRLLLALLVALLTVVAPAALPRADAAGALDVVAVLDEGAGACAVVAEVAPAPAAPLPADAARVSVDGRTVPATVTPLLPPDAPVALVVDATAAGAAALPQRLSAAAGLLLRLPPSTPVTVVVDQAPPQVVAERTTPAAAVHALAAVTPGGAGSTAQAVAQATAAMATPAAPAAASEVVMLGAAQPAPAGNAAADLATRFRTGNVVLALVTDPAGVSGGWAALARATGGAEAGADPAQVPDAVDALGGRLRSRYEVRFTPPAGAQSARVTLTAGGVDTSADVSLAMPAGQAASGAAAGQTPAPSAAAAAAPAADTSAATGRSGLIGLLVAAALLLVAAVFLPSWRRWARPRRPALAVPASPAWPGPWADTPGSAPSPEDLRAADHSAGAVRAGEVAGGEVPAGEVPADEVPADEVPADEVPPDEVPADEVSADELRAAEAPADDGPVQGVRVFDVSDPARPLEITGEGRQPHPPAYVGSHRQPGAGETGVAEEDDLDDVQDEPAAHAEGDDRAAGEADEPRRRTG